MVIFYFLNKLPVHDVPSHHGEDVLAVHVPVVPHLQTPSTHFSFIRAHPIPSQGSEKSKYEFKTVEKLILKGDFLYD